jgi:hypothetical protein
VLQVDASAELHTRMPCLQSWCGGGQGRGRTVALCAQYCALWDPPHIVDIAAAADPTVPLWLLLLTDPASVLPLQVIPIYGRGSDFDPRQEAIKVQPVPPRPAGQRPSAVQVSRLGSAAQQAGGKHAKKQASNMLVRGVIASLYMTDEPLPCAAQPTNSVISRSCQRRHSASGHTAVVASMRLDTCYTRH